MKKLSITIALLLSFVLPVSAWSATAFLKESNGIVNTILKESDGIGDKILKETSVTSADPQLFDPRLINPRLFDPELKDNITNDPRLIDP